VFLLIKKPLLITLTCFSVFISFAHAQKLKIKPETLVIRSDALVISKDLLGKNTKYDIPFKQLVEEADLLLKMKPLSVLDKSLVAASGDKHDYYSLATYWWPDPSKPNGLPYIRHDGERNPEIFKGTDFNELILVSNSVETLSLAYWYTGNEIYAAKATQLLNCWFINPATRMNPNLQYAQAIKGLNDGRGIGIIETHYLVPLVDGLALIEGSSSYTESDKNAMHAWLDKFYIWLTTSKNGLDEKAAKNNHGTWWDVQAVDFALAVGRVNEAKTILEEAKIKRIALQIEPDGRQPLELERTNSLNYSIFNLEALTTLARLGERVNVDLWKFTTQDGRNISKALSYVAPFADTSKKWPKEDLHEAKRERIFPLLVEALHHDYNMTWNELLHQFAGNPVSGQHWRLTWVNEN